MINTPVSGALVRARDVDGGDKMLLENEKGDKFEYGNYNLFHNATFLAISSKSFPPSDVPEGANSSAGEEWRRVWVIHDNVVVESHIQEPMLLGLLDGNKRYVVVDDKPYTMPNGERSSQNQSKGK